MNESSGQILVTVDKKEAVMFCWLRTDKQTLLDCVQTLRDFFLEESGPPFWRTQHGKEILVVPFE